MDAIPKKLHFIWFGSYLDYEKFLRLCAWSKLNLDYEIYFYYDPKQLVFSQRGYNELSWYLDNRIQIINIRVASFLSQSKNKNKIFQILNMAFEKKKRGEEHKYLYAMASDILRIELLFHFGGVYSDFDNIPLKPLSQLYAKHGFLVGGVNNGSSKTDAYTCVVNYLANIQAKGFDLINSLLAACKNHALFFNASNNLSDMQDSEFVVPDEGHAKYVIITKTGPGFFQDCLASFLGSNFGDYNTLDKIRPKSSDDDIFTWIFPFEKVFIDCESSWVPENGIGQIVASNTNIPDFGYSISKASLMFWYKYGEEGYIQQYLQDIVKNMKEKSTQSHMYGFECVMSFKKNIENLKNTIQTIINKYLLRNKNLQQLVQNLQQCLDDLSVLML